MDSKNQEITIRKAIIDDAERINSAAKVVFTKTFTPVIGKEQTAYMLERMYDINGLKQQISEGKDFFLAEDCEGNICGYMSCFPKDDGIFRIEKLYVMPQCQKTGLGKRFFDYAKTLAKGLNPKPKCLQLNVNRENPAVDFYLHIGMKIASQGDFPFGGGYFMNDYIMEYGL